MGCTAINDEVEIELSTPYLDQHRSHFLLGGECSWNDIPTCFRYRMKLLETWDCRFLLKHFESQLYTCTKTPAPKLPFNPFNREVYSQETLIKFLTHCSVVGLPVTVALVLVVRARCYYGWRNIQSTQTRQTSIVSYLATNGCTEYKRQVRAPGGT